MTSTDPDIKAIFVEALDLATDAERAVYLDRACAGSLAVRARVEALLGARLRRTLRAWLGPDTRAGLGTQGDHGDGEQELVPDQVVEHDGLPVVGDDVVLAGLLGLPLFRARGALPHGRCGDGQDAVLMRRKRSSTSPLGSIRRQQLKNRPGQCGSTSNWLPAM